MAQQFTQYSRQMELHELYRELKDSLTHILYLGSKHFSLLLQRPFHIGVYLIVLLRPFLGVTQTQSLNLVLNQSCYSRSYQAWSL